MAISPAQAEQRAIELGRLYAEAEIEILALMSDRLQDGIDAPLWAERKLTELIQLRREIEAQLAGLVNETYRQLSLAIEEAYETGLNGARADLAAAGIEGAFGRTNVAAIEALLNETALGIRSSHLGIVRQSLDSYREAVAEAVRLAAAGVETRRQAAQRVVDNLAKQGISGFVDSAGRHWEASTYAEMTTRTALGRSAIQGHLDTLQAAGRDLVIVSDSPEECPLCLVAGTIVEGPAPTGLTRSEYAGDVITIATARGNDLTGTPDHAVLTPQGWRCLKDLRPGDQVISDSGQQGYASVVPDGIQMPTRIEEAGKPWLPVLLAGPTRRDFNRDIAYREVRGIETDRHLLSEADPALGEPFSDLSLVGGFGSIFGGDDLEDCVVGASRPSVSLMGSFRPLPSLFGSCVVPALAEPFADHRGALIVRERSHVAGDTGMPRPSLDTGAPEIVGDYPAADAEGGAELLCRLASNVAPDEIISLSRTEFRGHVWDLSTAPGWFIANGIVTHNCRPWEGRVLSISGQTTGRFGTGDGAAIAVTGTVSEATTAGLFHPNCTHRLGLFVPGFTKRMRDTAAREDAYEERQQQRYLERNIRAWKRREAAGMTPEAREYAKRHREQWQGRMRDFISETDRRRQYAREQIGAV